MFSSSGWLSGSGHYGKKQRKAQEDVCNNPKEEEEEPLKSNHL